MDYVEISAIARIGLNQAEANFESAAKQIASTGSATSPDTVDLSTAMVSLLSARNDFSINLKTLEVGDEMQRNAIDLLA